MALQQVPTNLVNVREDLDALQLLQVSLLVVGHSNCSRQSLPREKLLVETEYILPGIDTEFNLNEHVIMTRN